MARVARLLLISSLFSATLWGCRGPVDTGTIPPPSVNDSTLGASDVFDVRVFNEETLSAA